MKTKAAEYNLGKFMYTVREWINYCCGCHGKKIVGIYKAISKRFYYGMTFDLPYWLCIKQHINRLSFIP